MSRIWARLPQFLGFLLLWCIALSVVTNVTTVPLHAQTPQTVDTVTVTAVIKPSRVIILNKTGKIEQIVSNTQEAVLPTVHQDSYAGKPLTLTFTIREQYALIIEAYHLQHARGVLYNASTMRIPAKTTINFSEQVSYLTTKFAHTKLRIA